MDKLLTWGQIPIFSTIVTAIWLGLGSPVPAWSTDIKALKLDAARADERQANFQLRSLLSVPPPTDPVARQNWDELLRMSRDQLQRAQDKQKELGR